MKEAEMHWIRNILIVLIALGMLVGLGILASDALHHDETDVKVNVLATMTLQHDDGNKHYCADFIAYEVVTADNTSTSAKITNCGRRPIRLISTMSKLTLKIGKGITFALPAGEPKFTCHVKTRDGEHIGDFDL